MNTTLDAAVMYEISRHQRRLPNWLGRLLARWGLARDAYHDCPVAASDALVIASSVHIDGLSCDGDVVVEGTLCGNVTAEGVKPLRVFVRANGRLGPGKVECDYLEVCGRALGVDATVNRFVFDSSRGGCFAGDGTHEAIVRYNKLTLAASDGLDAHLVPRLPGSVRLRPWLFVQRSGSNS